MLPHPALNKSGETPAQVAKRMNQESISHYLLNYNVNEGDVYPDGDANVNVSRSRGMFLPNLR